MPVAAIAEAPYRVQVRNTSKLLTGEITRLTSLKMIPRFNDVGALEMTIPTQDPKSTLLLKGGWISVLSNDTDTEILSAQIRGIKEVWDDNNIGGTLAVYGPSAEQVLADRVAFQVPGSVATSQAAFDYDRRNGVGETIIKAYVNLNAGPGAIVARRTSGLVIEADGVRGSTVKGSARMINLLELIGPLAQSAGLGFRVRFNGNSLEFQMYVPTDRTGTAKFGTALGNLVSYERIQEASKSNCAIVGGSGDGTARVFREILDSTAITAWSNRTETFIDRRDTADTTELDQAGTEETVTNGPITGLSIKTVDTPKLRFFVDYFLGDRVSIPEVGVSDVLRQIDIDWTADKAPSAETTVGTASTTGTMKMLQKLDALNKKVAALEAKK